MIARHTRRLVGEGKEHNDGVFDRVASVGLAPMMKAGSGMSASLGVRRLFDDPHFHSRICSRLIVRVGQRIGKELIARITHAAQIDLRFGD
jgi:hypothetical protein